MSKAFDVAKNFFNGLRGKGAGVDIDVATAVMIPLVAAMLADGYVLEEELLQIHSICTTSPIFERNSQAENEYLISYATKIIEDEGMANACALSARVLTPALRETAFVQAARVIYSDGYVARLEQEVLDQMTDWLGIDHERAHMMVEVVSIMQHPATA